MRECPVYVNVDVSEMNSRTDRELSQIGEIKTRIEKIGYYCIVVDVPVTNPREMKAYLERKLSDLRKKSYVTRADEDRGGIVPLAA